MRRKDIIVRKLPEQRPRGCPPPALTWAPIALPSSLIRTCSQHPLHGSSPRMQTHPWFVPVSPLPPGTPHVRPPEVSQTYPLSSISMAAGPSPVILCLHSGSKLPGGSASHSHLHKSSTLKYANKLPSLTTLNPPHGFPPCLEQSPGFERLLVTSLLLGPSSQALSLLWPFAPPVSRTPSLLPPPLFTRLLLPSTQVSAQVSALRGLP